MAGTLVQSTIDRIGDFLQDSQYQSLMVNSASYNVRIMRERKARMPFLDSQTGLPQSPVRPPPLPRHRLPSQHTLGQLYRYPAQPWRRRHRSYLARQQQAVQEAEASEHTILTVENPAAGSSGDDLIDKDAFYYEESVGFLDDDDDDLDNEDDDYDDDTYSMRSSRKRRGGKHGIKRTKGGFRGGGRKRRDGGVVGAGPVRPASEAEDIIAKPYECQRCSARYKTRQGLSYHLSHTHKADTSSNSAPIVSGVAVDVTPPLAVPTSTTPPTSEIQDSDRAATGDGSTLERILKDVATADGSSQLPVSVLTTASVGGSTKKSSCRSRKNSNTSSTASSSASVSAGDGASGTAADDFDLGAHSRPSKQNTFVATPNPYCDFCLGDSRFNKKTGGAEEMVSCSDCGRSGHPSCLQFTTKMMEAVARYRWQCIECKCCTLCGTAENDDQLLFCDDCDRGYHLYCVRPPLAEPPEGEWACRMCRHSE